MFEQSGAGASSAGASGAGSPERLARFQASLEQSLNDHEGLVSVTEESTGWVGRVRAAERAQNRAAGAQLVAIGALFAYRLSRCSETEEWAADTMDAVAAEVGAALRISKGRAHNRVQDARMMRERLPQVGAVFCAGDIDLQAFRVIALRTDLIEDRQVLAKVDGLIAANIGRWPSLTRGKLAAKVDAIVARRDRDAVHRRTDHQRERDVSITDEGDGLSRIDATVTTVDARAFDQRLRTLVATLCPHDPRSAAQRRADAFGPLAAYATRMRCLCGRPDCAAAAKPDASPVVIHVIAEAATLTGDSQNPGSMWDGDGLITPELIAELAATATLVPLTPPGDTAPEPNRRPSAALADFVRCRDLTCRWPGCEVPAAGCQLDHSIPWDQGGPTHAGNLNCKCPAHHLIKTFWGWTEQQLADGTLILTSPAGDTYVTTPGSALLFPSLCHAVGGMPAIDAVPPQDHCAPRTAMMPRRRRIRAQERAYRAATERHHNRTTRQAAQAANRPPPDTEPPPF